MHHNLWLTATSIVAGDIIRWRESVFVGSYRNAKYVGGRTVTAKVLRESYGAEKQQHTFSLEITACEGVQPLAVGTKTRRKGRNLYRDCQRLAWQDETARQVIEAEKHQRGDQARVKREARKNNRGTDYLF